MHDTLGRDSTPEFRSPWPSQTPDDEEWGRELSFAGRIQRALLESRSVRIAGAVACGSCLPRYAVGGDYFDFIGLPGGRLRVVVADVMGKGFGAGMLMTMFRAAVRSGTLTCDSPGTLLAYVNRLLYEDLQAVDSFITAACVDYLGESQSIVLASGGHPYPLLLRQGSAAPEPIRVRGVSLGMMPDRKYVEQVVPVGVGDRLLLFTDGIIEARDGAGHELTAGGLQRLISERADLSGPALLQALLDGVGAFTEGRGPHDDVTLAGIQFGEESP